MTQKTLERIHILRTILNYGAGGITAVEIVKHANAECDHVLLDDLPEISRRGIGQKLSAMSLDGLVTGDRAGPYKVGQANPPMVWAITQKGREMAGSLA